MEKLITKLCLKWLNRKRVNNGTLVNILYAEADMKASRMPELSCAFIQAAEFIRSYGRSVADAVTEERLIGVDKAIEKIRTSGLPCARETHRTSFGA